MFSKFLFSFNITRNIICLYICERSYAFVLYNSTRLAFPPLLYGMLTYLPFHRILNNHQPGLHLLGVSSRSITLDYGPLLSIYAGVSLLQVAVSAEIYRVSKVMYIKWRSLYFSDVLAALCRSHNLSIGGYLAYFSALWPNNFSFQVKAKIVQVKSGIV